MKYAHLQDTAKPSRRYPLRTNSDVRGVSLCSREMLEKNMLAPDAGTFVPWRVKSVETGKEFDLCPKCAAALVIAESVTNG